jgi:hypothetical protein
MEKFLEKTQRVLAAMTRIIGYALFLVGSVTLVLGSGFESDVRAFLAMILGAQIMILEPTL